MQKEDTLANIQAARPDVDWTGEKDNDLDDSVEAKLVYIPHQKGHVVIKFNSRVLCNKLLGQSNKLKGTKIYIGEEWTRVQIKERPTKLAKVKAARQEGKWAV